ncbi:hypothetical protein L3X39_03885 [Sabulilitoribacter multivorans]|uniref:Uncharacterized protein n=1 Tax=Flaviramulus multivorans TaxID=1304750 RepID=A0ABS9IG84_9FLAO|nr:hypothetical protein [Flaviramulus multivorans]MCF7559766.1 hypothetical protein [Flaviramulus multivorans]
MNTSNTLLIAVSVIVLVGILIQYFLWRDRTNDRKVLDEHWNKFLKSESFNDIKGIAFYGDKLIWNKHLTKGQLEKIIELVNSKVARYSQLEKLKYNAYNKKLHYDRPLPESGSSGGIKQSW